MDDMYHDIAADPKYQHFIRIPDRILQCMDYFGIQCDREKARSCLHTYYLFIGVVDNAIDNGRVETGRVILDYLGTPAPKIVREMDSSVRLVTEILKVHVCQHPQPVMMDKLLELYGEVVSERAATSIESYIAHRNSVGGLTAELSYLLIRPGLSGDLQQLCEFMQQVGAIGCLIDSLIDLHKDRRLGLLAFQPGVTDYAQLVLTILRDGSRLVLKHPRLFPIFLSAIVDNLRDPARAKRTPSGPSFVSGRKDETASVA